MDKPKPKDFGYEPANPNLGEEGGWLIEGGEEAYEAALAEWEKQQGPKHTPGPWVAGERTVYPESGQTSGIAYCHLGTRPYTEVYANAKLIAAAPEMLTELEKMYNYLNRPEMPIELFNMLHDVHALILKAKGE